MNYIFKSATEAWSVIYDELGNNYRKMHLIDNFFQSSPRNRLCNETIGLSFIIEEPQNCLMWSKVRKLSPIYLAKECLWYLSGDRTLDKIPSKVWLSLCNKDGEEKGLINSNYGAYLFTQKDNKYPELSVFDATIKLLKEDKDSRQAIVQIPIMKHRQDDDTPCTSSIQFLLRDNKLYCIVYMRSCDLWFGMPNDVTQFIIWQMMLAKELDVELGWYKHCFGSLHVYEENYIKDIDIYMNLMNETYLIGKENLSYFKYYDDRNYRVVLDEILLDFKVLADSNLSKEEIINKHMLKNEELKYMLSNMSISKFIH